MNNRNDRWVEDIEFLSLELCQRHKNLFFSKIEKDFYLEIENLKGNVHNFDDYEIQIELAKIVASIGDAHTCVSPYVRVLLPLELYWFSDRIYVIRTIPEYKDILYCKLTNINDVHMDEVINTLSLIVSYENESYLRSQLPKYLPAIELLYGLEIVDEIDSIGITAEDMSGNKREVIIKPLAIAESREKLKSNINFTEENNLPFYRKHCDKYYWFEYIKDFKTVYFKYNACRENSDKDIITFERELIEFINENAVDKLVIDLRNNFGGNSTLLDSFIEKLKICNKINKKGNLFIIVGRETFSSALLNVFSLKEKTNAIFIGEPTGGKPNCYGEVERFSLKNFGLVVSYSTEYYKIIKDDNLPSFFPDINIELTIENYVNNEDPCLDYILQTESE